MADVARARHQSHLSPRRKHGATTTGYTTGKEKSAMLKWDEPGFMDGVRCRPITASKKSKKSAVVGARACLSRGLITGSPYW